MEIEQLEDYCKRSSLSCDSWGSQRVRDDWTTELNWTEATEGEEKYNNDGTGEKRIEQKERKLLRYRDQLVLGNWQKSQMWEKILIYLKRKEIWLQCSLAEGVYVCFSIIEI